MINKTSSFALFLFMIASPFLLFTYFYVPLLLRTNQTAAVVIPAILLVIGIILIILLPKCIDRRDYFKLIKKSFFAKICLAVFLALSAILHLFIGTRVIAELFFYDYHYILFATMLIGISLFVSNQKTHQLINATTILLLIGFGLGMFPYYSTNNVKNYTYLMPFSELDLFLPLLYGLFFIFDLIAYIYLFPNAKKHFNRKMIILSLLITMIFFTLEVTHIIVLAGTSYLIEMEFIGFLTFSIQDAITYIGNLSFIYLYLVPLICVFKAGLEIEKLKDLLKIPSNVLSNVTIGLTISLAVIFIYKTDIFAFISVYMFFLLGLLGVAVIFIYLNRSEKYEIIF